MQGDNYYTNLCSINWHLLSLSDQKSISLLMVFAINPKSITMGLKVLNVESFLEVKNKNFIFKFISNTSEKFSSFFGSDLPGHLLVSHGFIKFHLKVQRKSSEKQKQSRVGQQINYQNESLRNYSYDYPFMCILIF